MTIDTNTIVSVTEANQNFSRVTRIAEKNGQAVIFKNNRPKYMLVDLDNSYQSKGNCPNICWSIWTIPL